MRLPTRIRLRTMMAIIALIAVGFGSAFELKNHIQRDLALRVPADRYREVAIHHRRALECQFALDRHEPYHPAVRAKLRAADRVRSMMPPSGFASWGAELNDHLYWGERIYGEAENCDQYLEAIEERLLLRVPTGR